MTCLKPYTNKQGQEFPCGSCPPCINRRVSSWAFRLKQEEKRSISSHFITLTYDSLHIPISGRGFRTLDKGDLQRFFKRLRYFSKHIEGSTLRSATTTAQSYDALQNNKRPENPIRYYAAGEYGSRNGRPHYHIILFNSTPELVSKAWSLENDQGKRVQIGDFHIGNVSGASIAYTLKYLHKKAWRAKHENDDRVPEFQLMSKGLGSNYLTNSMIEWHRSGDFRNKCYITLPGGYKCSMPRYYKDKIYPWWERNMIAEHFKNLHYEQEIKRACKNGPLTEQQRLSNSDAIYGRFRYRNELTDTL